MIKTERIFFHFIDVAYNLGSRKALKSFISEKFEERKIGIEEINFIFCKDAYLLELNQKHLQHNTLTDIITFEHSLKGQNMHSDLFISLERVRENASLFKTSIKNELHRVMFHGILHLLGFKDKNDKDQRAMRAMEEEWLDLFFYEK